MKAWLIDQLTGIKNLRLGDWPDPKAGPDEAVVNLEYAALNPADNYLAEGQYPARPTFPHILGRDGVGTITALGSTSTKFTVGQRVLILRGEAGVNRPGTLAERVAVPLDSIAPVPPHWSAPQAACAALVYLTAYQALTQWDEELVHPGAMPGCKTVAPSKGRVVLITGVSGGVGVACVQLAKAMGDTVIGLSRSEEKAQRVRELGTDLVLDPADKLWPKKVREFLNPALTAARPQNASEKASPAGAPKRVDLAVDNIGGALLPEVIETLGQWGKVSVVGRLAGPVPNFNTAMLFFRRLRIGGVASSTYTGAEIHAAWSNVLNLMSQTAAKPVVDQIFEFEQVPAAFARLADGPLGKVVVRIHV